MLCVLHFEPILTAWSHTPDDAALVLVVPLHVEVTVVRDGEYVRRQLAYLLVGVEADLVGSVDRQKLVGIHCHQDWACVSLQEAKNRRVNNKNIYIYYCAFKRQNVLICLQIIQYNCRYDLCVFSMCLLFDSFLVSNNFYSNNCPFHFNWLEQTWGSWSHESVTLGANFNFLKWYMGGYNNQICFKMLFKKLLKKLKRKKKLLSKQVRIKISH